MGKEHRWEKAEKPIEGEEENGKEREEP